MTHRLKMLPALLVLCSVAIPGCGDDEPSADDGQPIDKTALLAATQAQGPAKPKTSEGENFTYSPVGKRDPFRSYLAEIKDTQQASTRPVQETEKFELDQYRLTGIIHGTSQPKAMVEDPNGVGHTLRVGSRLGKNGGRVTRISAKGLIVIEEFVNPIGKRVRVPITLKLPEDPNAIQYEAN